MANSILELLLENGLKVGDSYNKALKILSDMNQEAVKPFADRYGSYDLSEVASFCGENKKEPIMNIGKNDNGLLWFLPLFMLVFGGIGNNDSYYRGKCDAYENILSGLTDKSEKPTFGELKSELYKRLLDEEQ